MNDADSSRQGCRQRQDPATDSSVPVIGRFAPTPSGRMHIGNLCAMLAAWLSARSHRDPQTGDRGRMLLRIEDLDIARAVPGADRWMMDDLAWLGLYWDGDPVYQSQRTELYEQALHILEQRPTPAKDAPALIYPCFCSRTDIRASAAPNEGDGFVVYPGTCRSLGALHPARVQGRLERGDQHSLRIAMPAADARARFESFDDRVFGVQRFDLARQLGDSVIRRADGVFSYQLAVVVDDLLMGVNDIVRGRDLLRSTALQMWIRRQLLDGGLMGGVAAAHREPGAHPRYAHVPLIRDAHDRRLAKRERSLDMAFFRDQGARPDQIIGCCAWLLGIRADDAAQKPVPMTAEEACSVASWDALRTDISDKRLPDDFPETIQSM